MDDPYSPPNQLDDRSTVRHEGRTGIPRAMGVMSIIVAVLAIGLAATFMAIDLAVDTELGRMAAAPPEADDDLFDTGARLVAGALTLEIELMRASSYGLLVMSILLIALGVGQVRYRRWARIGSVVWAGLGLTLIIVAICYSYLVVQPAWDAIIDGLAEAQAADPAPGWSGVLKYVLFVPFPLLVLGVFSSRRIGRAMCR